MDSGVNTDKTFTVEERIESGTFPDDSNFSDKEIIGVMDAIFASQVNNKHYSNTTFKNSSNLLDFFLVLWIFSFSNCVYLFIHVAYRIN